MHFNTTSNLFRQSNLLRIQFVLIFILVSALAVVSLQGCSSGKSSSSANSSAETQPNDNNPEPFTLASGSGVGDATADGAISPYPNFVSIINKTRNGTVNIVVEQLVAQQSMLNHFNGVPNGGIPSDLFEEFFGEFFQQPNQQQPPKPRKSESQGSGFVLNQEGYIITNNHVVANQTKIVVTLSSGNAYNATLIGTDPLTDLALIKIDVNGAEPLTPLPLGDSSTTNIGEWVLAIGSPYGLDATVTAGIISAKDRSIQSGPFDSFLQTDASINPGNSGGPLINMAGEVIGINTAIYRSAHGLGFSIPINTLTNLLPQLLNNSVVHGWIGVTLQELTPELAKSFGVPSSYNQAIVIADVVAGDPADKSGLMAGDVILEADNSPIQGFRGFAQTVGSTKPGDTVSLGILRNGKRMTVKVVVGERPETLGNKNNDNNKNNDDNGGASDISNGKITVIELDNKTKEEYNVTYGVGISAIASGSNATDAGLQPGLIILDINANKITSTKVFLDVFTKIKAGESVNMRVASPRGKTYIVYKKD